MKIKGRMIVGIGKPEDTCQPTNIVNCFTHSQGTRRVGPKFRSAPVFRFGTGGSMKSVVKCLPQIISFESI